MADERMRPDEEMLRLHLGSGRFLSGVASGRWRLIKIEWPCCTIAVTASDGVEYGFRFHCQNYPQGAASAQPWDIERDAALAAQNWPKGKGRVALAFNPGWQGGTCLYLPCDRQSIEGHDNWRHEHPALLWDPAKGLCKYLEIIHDLLHSQDYGGRHAA